MLRIYIYIGNLLQQIKKTLISSQSGSKNSSVTHVDLFQGETAKLD